MNIASKELTGAEDTISKQLVAIAAHPEWQLKQTKSGVIK